MKSIFATPDVVRTPLDGGGFTLASRHPLGPYPDRITDHLVRWAEVDPDRPLLAQRGDDGQWVFLSFARALQQARSVGQYLLDRGCGPDAPAVCIAENSLDAACFALGALYAGVPYAPISPSYATVAAAFDKLQSCLELLRPRVLFLGSTAAYGAAARKACGDGVLLMARGEGADVRLEDALDAQPSTVDAAHRRIGPDQVAKYLFTSGSTGTPKAVINTQRMLCANQKQFDAIFPFVASEPPVLVDWLPWHHTFGGNEAFYLVMSQGGTLYIDTGKPLAGAMEQTIANLKSVSPTIYFNVPLGYDQLVSRMKEDAALRKMFFARLQMAFYSGAGMPQRTWTQLEELSLECTGRRVPVVTAWGATETAPLATAIHFEARRSDNIGLPVPACEVKFAPVDGRYELRVRGPNVMPGYLGRPDLSATVFDEEGYYRSGDSAVLVDEEHPAAGIAFGGRITEDFKLQTGSWVSVGRLRGLLMGELIPVASHVVVAGADRDSIGLLVFLDLHGARNLVQDAALSLHQLSTHPRVLAAVAEAVERHNANNPGTSVRVGRFAVMPDAPSVEAREITDKGSINQAAVLRHRAKVVESLWEAQEHRSAA